ncbi:YdcF family protein [Alloiococcus sp. CFN-8]|uniref:YdcF family protein n=1 Tax=Alloiococcus sp. CFN-8 TaxID=3416081 RepID=UPI003CF0D611
MKKNLHYRRFTKILIVFFVVFIVWFIVHTLMITYDGLRDNINFTDAAVVLGNKVETDGTPSNRLKSRLDKAIELYEKGYFDYIIVSGGTGKEGFDEAEVMRSYLMDKGISDEYIILDHDGYNSYMTAENTKAIMDKMDFHSVTIITQFFHISRTELAFKKVGVEEIYSAHADYFELRDIYSLVREFPAYYKYLLFY